MEDQRSRHHLPLGLVVGFSALALATGSAVAWLSWQGAHKAQVPAPVEHAQSSSEKQNPPAIAAPNTAQTHAIDRPSTAVEKTLQVYWLRASGSAIALSPSAVTLSASDTPDALLEAAVDELLAGPSNAAVTTTIPRDTKLRSLSVKGDGIHINLSQSFTGGGGSTSMTARVGQILYTVTSLNPNASVWVAVEGKPLETLGGEGLMLEQPLTRDRFDHDFPLK